MIKITAIIIAKNEEKMIADCIDSVEFCDQIVFIDGGSTDRTKEIAKKMGVNVYEHQTFGFAQMRNVGLEKAKGEWVFYIDADERVGTELIESIKKIISTKDEEYAAYKVKRKNFYFGNHPWPYIEKMERLFKKEKLKKWTGVLHESPKIEGKIGETSGFLFHYTHRDLSMMVEKTNLWSEEEASLRFDAHHPSMKWWRFPRVMASAFLVSYIKQKGYKAGTGGLVESIYQAFSMFITYAKLWELQNEKK